MNLFRYEPELDQYLELSAPYYGRSMGLPNAVGEHDGRQRVRRLGKSCAYRHLDRYAHANAHQDYRQFVKRPDMVLV